MQRGAAVVVRAEGSVKPPQVLLLQSWPGNLFILSGSEVSWVTDKVAQCLGMPVIHPPMPPIPSWNVSVSQGVSVPKVKPEVPPPLFGFVDNAERINSRAAMVSAASRSCCWHPALPAPLGLLDFFVHPPTPTPLLSIPQSTSSVRPASSSAQLAFLGLLLLEAIANKGILELLGISTGTGLTS